MEKNQIRTQVTIAVFAIVAAGMEALFALCLGKTFDVIEMKRLDYLITLLAAVVILTVADSVLCVWMRSLAHRSASQRGTYIKETHLQFSNEKIPPGKSRYGRIYK